MKVIIASLRAPKVSGVQRAFQKIPQRAPFINITFEPMEVESGVQATPLSIDELMNGARQRAEIAYAKGNIQSKKDDVVFSVGVEGGVYTVQKYSFLQSWACVYDGRKFSFGSSGSIEIPRALAHAVVENGADLGKVIDVFAEQQNVRSNQGTWGILTSDLITREDSFALATLNALAPFFNEKLYGKEIPPR